MLNILPRLRRKALLFLGLAAALTGGLLGIVPPSAAQIEFDPERDVNLSAAVQPPDLLPGGSGRVIVTLRLPQNVHITSRSTGFFFLSPDSARGINWGEVQFPAPAFFEGDTVYRGDVVLSVPFVLPAGQSVGVDSVAGTVGYQICTENEPRYCTAPVERRFAASFQVISGKAGASTDSSAGSVETRVRRALESGSILALLWIYIGGVLLSFTPCVYPVIPITIAFVGARAGTNKARALAISLVFVLGLAIVYSILGLAAAATGGVFGFSTQNPYVQVLVTVVFLVMGAGMLGAFTMTLPSSLQTKLAGHQKGGYVGALLVGGTTGLVAVPCVGPVLVALLGWISSTHSLFLGALYLFVFACGLGTLFVVIGTFAGVLTALPKAGVWMEYLKEVFGLILIAAAYYFGRPLIPANWFTLLVGLGLLLLAGYLRLFNRLPDDAGLGARLGRGIAVFVAILGGFYIILGLARLEGVNLTGVAAGKPEVVAASEARRVSDVNWIWNDETAARDAAKSKGKPLLIDFWADWCASCNELDHKTFSDPRVAGVINDRFVALKMDGSKVTPEVKGSWSRYRVRGLPTVLVLTADGGTEKARLEAFRTADEMLPLLIAQTP